MSNILLLKSVPMTIHRYLIKYFVQCPYYLDVVLYACASAYGYWLYSHELGFGVWAHFSADIWYIHESITRGWETLKIYLSKGPI